MNYPNIQFRDEDFEIIERKIVNKDYTRISLEDLFKLKRQREEERLKEIEEAKIAFQPQIP